MSKNDGNAENQRMSASESRSRLRHDASGIKATIRAGKANLTSTELTTVTKNLGEIIERIRNSSPQNYAMIMCISSDLI
jgi:hypothetical protein